MERFRTPFDVGRKRKDAEAQRLFYEFFRVFVSLRRIVMQPWKTVVYLKIVLFFRNNIKFKKPKNFQPVIFFAVSSEYSIFAGGLLMTTHIYII